jgi:hypothetical protein
MRIERELEGLENEDNAVAVDESQTEKAREGQTKTETGVARDLDEARGGVPCTGGTFSTPPGARCQGGTLVLGSFVSPVGGRY